MNPLVRKRGFMAKHLKIRCCLLGSTVSIDQNEEYVAELELADPDSFDVKAGLRAGPLAAKPKANGLLENHKGEKHGRRKSKTIADEDFLP